MHLWQKEPNATWYTEEPVYCDFCRGKKEKIIEMFFPGGKSLFCFDHLKEQLSLVFYKNPDLQYVETRMIFDHLYHSRPSIRKREREKMTLSLRYQVMKAGDFKCVLCGTPGKKERIEIDHIVPISKGGKTVFSNLQVLCFRCNRGKSNK